MIIIIIIIIIIALIYFKYIKPIITLNNLKLGSFNIVTGGVKTGKSTLAIWIAINKLKVERIKTKIRNLFRKKSKKLEMPMLYSNIPIITKWGYIPLTKEILTRKSKPIENSIIYMGEFSLIAESMNYEDKILNEQILLFFKLFGHEFGGTIICDTQNISDCHFAIKKIATKYIYIDKGYKSPLFYNMYVREIMYNYENNGINNNVNNKGSLEEQETKIKISKKIWRTFDYRCYSALTDNLPTYRYSVQPKEIETLKQMYIVTFNKWKTEQMRKIEEEEEKRLKKGVKK